MMFGLSQLLCRGMPSRSVAFRIAVETLRDAGGPVLFLAGLSGELIGHELGSVNERTAKGSARILG
jgi:hypothetical protein